MTVQAAGRTRARAGVPTNCAGPSSIPKRVCVSRRGPYWTDESVAMGGFANRGART